MHEIILEIIQRNYNEFTGTNEAEICSASEIASLVRRFLEWAIIEQEIFFGDLNQCYLINDNPYKDGKKLKTLDELFSYWYNNVRKEKE